MGRAALDCRCKRCADRRTRGQEPAHSPKELIDREAPKMLEELPKAKVYVVTYAQNATPAHRPFFAALLQYCVERKAQLVVVPGRYKNPTSVFSRNMLHDEWWDERISPFLFQGRGRIGRKLIIYGDVSIQPTATHPLTGFEVFAGEASAIFGHPKLQLTTVATAKRRYPRIFTTTGAVTVENYTDSKAGKKGEAHHVLGAAVVEVTDDGIFHLRQINAKRDGSFIDLDREYFPDRASKRAPPALGLVCGDVHVAHEDKAVLEATFGRSGSICEVIRPKKIVYHDLLDFDARNHHDIHDFMDRFARKREPRRDSVALEVMQAARFIDDRTPRDAEAIVVRSNHDEAFDRWLKESNPFHDATNAAFWFKTWTALVETFEKTGRWLNPLAHWYAQFGKGRAKFLERDEPFRIGSSWVNFHGDHGINGAIGSIRGFAKLGAKSIIGHGHSPGICDGCYQVGVMSLDQGYNEKGPSSWLTTHSAIYGNDKRTLIHVIGGKWRG